MHLINLLLIQLIVVFIVDLSGIVDTLKQFIWRKWIKVGDWRLIRLKPVDCSLCSTWWCCIIYLLITGNLNLITILVSAVLAFLASTAGDFLTLIKDTITKIITKLYELLHL